MQTGPLGRQERCSSSAGAVQRANGSRADGALTYYYKENGRRSNDSRAAVRARGGRGETVCRGREAVVVAGEGMDGWVQRQRQRRARVGSLRSGEVSQGSCKAGRGWRRFDGWGCQFADRRVSQVEAGAVLDGMVARQRVVGERSADC
jgi:hypothetical protein